jgi:branched-subunit amino acid transport protein
MGLITFLLRLSFITLLSRIHLSALVKRSLDFVPPAVLSALIFSDLFRSGLVQPISMQLYSRLIAGIIAVLVAWRTRNVVLTIGVGLLALLILQALL